MAFSIFMLQALGISMVKPVGVLMRFVLPVLALPVLFDQQVKKSVRVKKRQTVLMVFL